MSPTSLKLRRARKVLLLALSIIILGAYLAVEQLSEEPKLNLPTVESKVIEKIPELGFLIFPEIILQGDPVLVIVDDLSAHSTSSGQATTTFKSLTFNGKSLGVFIHNGRPSALIGIDLRMAPGSYPLVLTLSNGQTLKKNLVVTERVIAKVPLGIPEELGGDTPESEKELINTLVQEGAIINAIPTAKTKLWSGLFRLPLLGPIVITDIYGYSRLTGASTFSHKGTDFRALVGTPVYAMNSGTVQFASTLRNYGQTIGIDHGLGLLTIYMHLSEIDVELGQRVEKGQLVGKSGATGYVLGPHLHLTVRINAISIDPEKFTALLGE